MSKNIDFIINEIRVQLFIYKHFRRTKPESIVITISPKLAVQVDEVYKDTYDKKTTLFGERLMYSASLDMNQFIIGEKFEREVQK